MKYNTLWITLGALLLVAVGACKEEKIYINTVLTTTVYNSEKELFAISFFDATTGVVAGEDGTLLMTTDGGTTWTQVNAPTPPGTGVDFYDVDFLSRDSFVVMAAGTNDGYLYLTADGGNTFAPLNIPNLSTHARFQAIDARNWVVLNDNEIRITTDRGKPYWESYSTFGSFQPWGVCFTDPLNGYTLDFDGKMQHTTNGGKNWSQVYNAGAGFQKRFLGGRGSMIYSGGGGTDIAVSKDAGAHWIESSVTMSEFGKNSSNDGVTVVTIDHEGRTVAASGTNALLLSNNSGESFTEYFKEDGSSLTFFSLDLFSPTTGIGMGDHQITKFDIKF